MPVNRSRYITEEGVEIVKHFTKTLALNLQPYTNKHVISEQLVYFVKCLLDKLGVDVSEDEIMNTDITKEIKEVEMPVKVNSKAELKKTLDYISRRMNKAADKMIVASKKAEEFKADENTYKAYLKKYNKHRLSYLWYKKLLEDIISSEGEVK